LEHCRIDVGAVQQQYREYRAAQQQEEDVRKAQLFWKVKQEAHCCCCNGLVVGT
jgi:hypothetical protein